MKKIKFSLIAGLIFGIVDVLVMIPLPMQDKNIAMLAAFFNRFAIGFLVAVVDLPMSYWKRGVLIGLLLSLSDALITKAYVPILGIGIIGGLVIGLLADKQLKGAK